MTSMPLYEITVSIRKISSNSKYYEILVNVVNSIEIDEYEFFTIRTLDEFINLNNELKNNITIDELKKLPLFPINNDIDNNDIDIDNKNVNNINDDNTVLKINQNNNEVIKKKIYKKIKILKKDKKKLLISSMNNDSLSSSYSNHNNNIINNDEYDDEYDKIFQLNNWLQDILDSFIYYNTKIQDILTNFLILDNMSEYLKNLNRKEKSSLYTEDNLKFNEDTCRSAIGLLTNSSCFMNINNTSPNKQSNSSKLTQKQPTSSNLANKKNNLVMHNLLFKCHKNSYSIINNFILFSVNLTEQPNKYYFKLKIINMKNLIESNNLSFIDYHKLYSIFSKFDQLNKKNLKIYFIKSYEEIKILKERLEYYGVFDLANYHKALKYYDNYSKYNGCRESVVERSRSSIFSIGENFNSFDPKLPPVVLQVNFPQEPKLGFFNKQTSETEKIKLCSLTNYFSCLLHHFSFFEPEAQQLIADFISIPYDIHYSDPHEFDFEFDSFNISQLDYNQVETEMKNYKVNYDENLILQILLRKFLLPTISETVPNFILPINYLNSNNPNHLTKDRIVSYFLSFNIEPYDSNVENTIIKNILHPNLKEKIEISPSDYSAAYPTIYINKNIIYINEEMKEMKDINDKYFDSMNIFKDGDDEFEEYYNTERFFDTYDPNFEKILSDYKSFVLSNSHSPKNQDSFFFNLRLLPYSLIKILYPITKKDQFFTALLKLIKMKNLIFVNKNQIFSTIKIKKQISELIDFIKFLVLNFNFFTLSNLPLNFSLILVTLYISYEKNHTSITKNYLTYNNPVSIVTSATRSILSTNDDLNILRSTFKDNFYNEFRSDQKIFIEKLETERLENLELNSYYEKDHKRNIRNQNILDKFNEEVKDPFYESDDYNSDDELNEFFNRKYTIIPSSLMNYTISTFNKDKNLESQILNFFHYLLLRFNYLDDNVKKLIFYFLNIDNLKNFKVLYYLFLSNEFLYQYFHEDKEPSISANINSKIISKSDCTTNNGDKEEKEIKKNSTSKKKKNKDPCLIC